MLALRVGVVDVLSVVSAASRMGMRCRMVIFVGSDGGVQLINVVGTRLRGHLSIMSTEPEKIGEERFDIPRQSEGLTAQPSDPLQRLTKWY
jgi:hypothetical protein